MSNTKILNKFGSRIRELRRSKGLTQEALADRAKLHYTYVGVVERGQKNVSLINIEKLINALGVSLASFFSSFR